MSVLDFLSTNFTELLTYFNDANKRIFWVYIASALLLALPVYWLSYKSRSVRGFFSYVFPKDVYTARSARHDYALLVLNKLIKAALFPLIIFTMAPIALGITSIIETFFGERNFIELQPNTIMIVFTVFLFLVDDFTRFFLHYILHRIPFLWEFHKVHHSATVLTPFTIYRSHPVESYLYACRMAITQGVVVGVCYYFFGPTLKMIDVLGANVFVFLFNFLGSNLRHSHIWLSWGDKVENWWLSPAQHQIHHSDQPKYHHSNFGAALAIWDRLFNTHTLASKIKELTFGVGDKKIDHSSLINIYCQPFVIIANKIRGKG